MIYDCINFHFTDYCNFKCKHCFVKKEKHELSLEKIKKIIDKVYMYFKKYNINGRINLAGGEPLLSENINEIIDYIYKKGIQISIITNGYYLTDDFIIRNKNKLSCIGISIDSLNDDINRQIGRSAGENVLNVKELKRICKIIKDNNIKLKINTCLLKSNVKECFSDFLKAVKPERYKVFEMLCYKESLLEELKPSNEDISLFKAKHREYISVYESAEEMLDSYVIIDSNGNLSTNNLHTSNLNVLENDFEFVINKIALNYSNYIKRYS